MSYSHDISSEEMERIDRFLTRQMNAAEEKVFQQELSENTVLREKTEEIRLLQLGIQEEGLRNTLNSFHRDIKGEKFRSPVLPMRRWLIAACLFILAGAAVWWLFFSAPAHVKLYDQYYSPDPGLATVMSSSADYEFEKAMVEYKSGKYARALSVWTALYPSQPGNDTLIYFIGAAHQAVGESREAKAYLEKLVGDSSKSFYKDANWYLGLCYLKEGENKKAISYLEKSGYPQASNIINAINK